MLDRWINDVFAGFQRTFSRPLLAYYSANARLDSMSPATSRRLAHRRLDRTDLLKQSVAEFEFERAIEAYEALIDSTFAEGRQ